MCPARFFEVCEGDFSIRVSSQKTKNQDKTQQLHTPHTDTHRTKLSKPQRKRHHVTTRSSKSQPLNPPKCEQTPSERWLTARQPSLAVTAHTTLINSSL